MTFCDINTTDCLPANNGTRFIISCDFHFGTLNSSQEIVNNVSTITTYYSPTHQILLQLIYILGEFFAVLVIIAVGIVCSIALRKVVNQLP